MRHSKLLGTSVSVVALLAGQTVLADVTAQQVWDSWKGGMLMSAEGTLTIGSENMSGGVLTVSDLAININEDGTVVSAVLDELVFTENGDGTVSVTMSEDYPITVTDTGFDGTETMVSMALRQTGMVLTVSGTPEELTHDMTADRYAFELDSVSEPGTDASGSGMFALNDMAVSYTMIEGELRSVMMALSVGSVDVLLDVNDPETGTIVNISGQIADLESDASMVIPATIETSPETVLADGLAFEGGYSFGNSAYVFNVTESGMAVAGSVAIESGETEVALDSTVFAYGSGTRGIAVDVTGGMIPFPVSISLTEYGVAAFVPLSQTAEPAEFGAGLTLSELSVNDEIWAMIDPGAVLPRDPATAIIDVTGTARLFYDIADPAQATALAMADVPGEIHSLNLNDLVVSIAGAQISGAGAFTFDNADLATFGGIPRPLGEVSLQINGVNGLIDNLVSMGLLPEDQVMAARMMMGLFTVATGDDQLTSKIEVNAEGHLLANGQRLQ